MSDDNQLVALLENSLLTPASDFYIAKILHNPDGSALDPRSIQTLDLGMHEVEGISIGVVLKNVLVQGLSNVQVKFTSPTQPEISVEGNTVTFHAQQPDQQADYQRPSDVPNQILMKGELDITLAGQTMPPGTISVTVNTVGEILGIFEATEQVDGQPSTAVVTFTKFAVFPSVGGGNIVIQVDLNTVFKDTINYVLNQPDSLQKLIDQVNQELATPDVLAALSQSATDAARKA